MYHTYRYLLLSLLVTGAYLFSGCGDETPVVEEAVEENEDGSKTVSVMTKASIPILPADLPIFPTSLSLGGISSFVLEKKSKYIDDFLSDSVPTFTKPIVKAAVEALIGENTIESAVSALEKGLQETTTDILNPGALSTTVENQISALKEVEITSASLKIAVKNTTNKYAAVPSNFKLYFGEKSLVDAKDELVEIVFSKETDQQDVSQATELGFAEKEATIKPDGKTYSYTSESIPNLVSTLNRVLKGEADQEIALGYVNDFMVADVSNGADITAIVKKLGGCVVSKALESAAGSYLSKFAIPNTVCPDYEQLLGWSLTMEGMEILVEAKTNVLEIPPVPSCGEIANKLKLSKYEKACEFVE